MRFEKYDQKKYGMCPCWRKIHALFVSKKKKKYVSLGRFHFQKMDSKYAVRL